jgi:hypothetical protein
MQGRMGAMAELSWRAAGRTQSIHRPAHRRHDTADGLLDHRADPIATHENLAKLQERLAVIDTAQNNIQSLARDVVGLQAILSNKQTRGAFGQSRMETIIKDGLPMGAFRLQPTLSNGMRPDCTIEDAEWRAGAGHRCKVSARSLERDARGAGRSASGEQAAFKAAQQRFRRDMEVHIRDISDKYLIAGKPRTRPSCSCRRNRSSRRFMSPRSDRSQGAAGAGCDCLSFASDAVDPGDPGAAQGCADARTGTSDPGRGGPADGRSCRGSMTGYPQAAGTFFDGAEGRRADPDLV